MSDVNVVAISGRIVDKIDFTIGKNNTPVAQFFVEGTFGKIKVIAMYAIAETIKEKYHEGSDILLQGCIKEDNWTKANNEDDHHWEIVADRVGYINLIVLTGGIKDEPVNVASKTSDKMWTTFKLACGHDYTDKQRKKGDPVIIGCWTAREKFGAFLKKHFKLGVQPTIIGDLKMSGDGKKASVFLSSVHIWWNALKALNGTAEFESELERKRRRANEVF